jgi:hypothetical protein
MRPRLLVISLAIYAGACGFERRPAADCHFAVVQARGRVAMGVDQYTSTHLFQPLSDGGRIEL